MKFLIDGEEERKEETKSTVEPSIELYLEENGDEVILRGVDHRDLPGGYCQSRRKGSICIFGMTGLYSQLTPKAD